MAQLTLVLGGMRSGKSRLAEELAAARPPVVYLATAQAGDAEMAARIAAHRERRAAREPPWHTLEEPRAIARILAAPGGAGCILVECVPLWLTNLLLGEPPRSDEDIRQAVAEVIDVVRSSAVRVVLVSSEVGCGIVPVNSLARRFGDLLGETNQHLAAAADEVWWCVAGLSQRLK